MAKFSDQFEKRDPLTFTAFGIFEFWLRQIAWEARDLLKGRTALHLKEIGSAVEALIETQLQLLLSKPDEAGDPRLSANPKAIGYGGFMSPKVPELLRSQHSDVNLFVAGCSLPEAGGMRFEQWEGLAVLALWKLIDFFEIITAPRRELGENAYLGGPEPTDKRKHQALMKCTPDLVEAMRACTLAGEAKMRLQQLAAMKSSAQREVSKALYEAEEKRRSEVSEKSRAAVAVRHDKTKDHRAEALKHANSKRFKSRAEAARYAADMVEKGPKTFYTVAVVEGWLKAAGWRRQEAPTA